jgi:PPOX class probable F420-dependent enzyme
MPTLSPAARQLLESDRLAHVVTLNPDGTPHVTCVWVGLDGDEIVFASMGPWKKLQNLDRDPRIALSIEGDRTNPMGLVEYLVVNGTARMTSGGGAALLQRLARTYLGPGVKFPDANEPPPGTIVHISVEKVSGVGKWTEG